MAWITEHWETLLVGLGGLWALLSAIVALTPSKEDDKLLAKAAGFLSFLAPKTNPGMFKFPLTPPKNERS